MFLKLFFFICVFNGRNCMWLKEGSAAATGLCRRLAAARLGPALAHTSTIVQAQVSTNLTRAGNC